MNNLPISAVPLVKCLGVSSFSALQTFLNRNPNDIVLGGYNAFLAFIENVECAKKQGKKISLDYLHDASLTVLENESLASVSYFFMFVHAFWADRRKYYDEGVLPKNFCLPEELKVISITSSKNYQKVA